MIFCPSLGRRIGRSCRTPRGVDGGSNSSLVVHVIQTANVNECRQVAAHRKGENFAIPLRIGAQLRDLGAEGLSF
jgi:hypothetical protein